MNGIYVTEHTDGTKEFGASLDKNRNGDWQINIVQPIKKRIMF